MRRWRRACALAVAVAVLAAGCGDDSSDGGGNAAATTDGGTPKRGGTLTFGVFGENLGFDPVVSNGVGTNGGHEMNAIYDTLMRWDPVAKKYVPRLAQSLEPNADFSEWTLKLKQNVKFTDGTSFDADAVVFNLKRHPQYNARFAGLVRRVKDMTVVDPSTVKLTLTAAWSGFPFVLTLGPGMIASPTALKACGDKAPRECEFNTKPVGAGPFQMESFRPKEATVLRKNAGYHGGEPYLDAVRFVYIAGAGPTYEALKNNTIQAGFLREPETIQRAKDEKTGGFEVLNWLGELVLINNGVKVRCVPGNTAPACAGKTDGSEVATTPITADKRIRQAVAAALDPKVIDERANAGKGVPGADIFMKGSQWHTGTTGAKFDPNRAKQLVEEVKKEGKWDGTIKYSCNNSPQRQNVAIAIKTLLENVGFKVTVKNDYDLLAVIQDIQLKKDFELACWGFSIYEDEPFVNFESNLSSTSTGNWMGYANPQVDAAIEKAMGAKTTDDKKKAFDEIAKIWADDVPSIGIGATAEYIAWRSEVKGIQMQSTTTVLFDKAWLG